MESDMDLLNFIKKHLRVLKNVYERHPDMDERINIIEHIQDDVEKLESLIKRGVFD